MNIRKIPPALLLLEAGSPQMTEFNLSRPDRIDWPKPWNELQSMVVELKGNLLAEFETLVDLALATHFLLTPPEQTDPFARQSFIAGLNPEILPAEIFEGSGNWRLIPVVVVPHGQESIIRYFMVGTLATPCDKIWPNWMPVHLDRTSLSAISDAFEVAQSFSGQRQSLFTFPLRSPDDGRIHGRSLGLPMTLAALSALTGHPLASNLLATGDIRCDSSLFPIEAVADIPAKAQAAVRQKIRLMLIPKASLPLTDQPTGIVIKAAGDLKEAWLWARLHTPGREKDLELLNQVVTDPSLLVNNCLDIDRDILEWVTTSEYGNRLAETITTDSTCLKNLVGKMDDCLLPADRDLKRAAILGGFISESGRFKHMGHQFPLLAFKWAVMNLVIANHCGNNEQSHYWSEEAKIFRQVIRSAEPREYAKFINNMCVSRHNTYTFHPDPPIKFLEELEEEKNHHRGLSYVLGSMYGTLAQNFAFSGPAHLANVIRNVHLAQEEFGNGVIPEYRAEWIREFSYLIYAYLDAKDLDAAKQSLWRYLEIDSWSGKRQWTVLNPFERFALIRYLADSTHQRHDTIEYELAAAVILEAAESPLHPGHPAQLISWNLGRLSLAVHNLALAADWFETSITLSNCGDETIRTMALLPLSGLHNIGRLTIRHIESFESVRESIRSSQFLNRDHFAAIMEGNIFCVLERLWEYPETIFPFMYR